MATVTTYFRIWIVLALAIWGVAPLHGQILQVGGKSFVFSIPEDASNIYPSTPKPKILVHVLSSSEGAGTLEAPNGFKIDFTYTGNTLREIELPTTLMHGRTAGKQRIGISIRTTTSVHLVLHLILPFAGESTQIWPVESLGKEYIVPSWGPVNDIDENNHAEIAITPVNDETAVTITPSARTIDGLRKDTTFTLLLNAGDSYILKADTSSRSNGGLSGTRIKASGPVSVMTAVTCGYVPQGRQACNMLLDHVLPVHYMGTVFYASPLGDTVRPAYLIFTAPEKNYTITLSDGTVATAANGRATVKIMGPVRCSTSTMAFCNLLTPGVDEVLVSDPSLVTVLPTTFYQENLHWFTPNMVNDGMPFYHTVNVITPTSGLSTISFDDKPLTSVASSAIIAGTDHSVVQIVVQPGVHRLRSHEPIFGVASGFYTADAYSFLPMGSAVPSGVRDQPEYDLEVSVRPNPADKTITLDMATPDSNVELVIFNALGNAVLRLAGNPADLHTIDISTLPAGSYTVEVLSGTHRGRSRFVISR